ncbi:type I-E CRISPR-associated protein Cas6/Cse3/CasE [Leptospira sp. 85282-16]|uniref:type I-E CRISPR-associated protein Cas6/Cse3/CasE n=1 Tax=Leptospira sp. 85282-16 TaxID=2971256 RepID=UPI0021BF53E8|nr:type I-E CRISPR-associated protein Cas6/Cse3/CasE [Leptospira sp. 85282-16]MCT8335187.1 type I-E CRISPR-associated protein Cas6/Cse3/CasE [Leptospira sp. 85282-16]
MYLSNLEIDPKNIKAARWITNPYKIHQRLWMGFEKQKSAIAKPDFLYRVEENFKQAGETKPRILVLSNISPVWDDAFQAEEFIKGKPQILNLNLDNFIEEDRSFRFSLKTNPTKKIKDHRSYFKKEIEGLNEEEIKKQLEILAKSLRKEEWEKIKSKRVGIYKEHEQIDWLKRKSEQSGFQILNLQLDHGEKESAQKKTDGRTIHNIDLLSVTFSGILRVTNVNAFKQAYCNGIGSGKAFGCGMLLLAKV